MPSRRNQINMTPEEIDEFLHGRRTMNVATFNHDGTIHLVAMWYGFNAAGQPAFETFTKSQKIKNLRRDPRITCLVETGDQYDQLKGVELVGTATLTTDDEAVMEVAGDVVRRYMGVTEPDDIENIARMLARKRTCVTIQVDRIVSWDHTKLGGTY